MTAAAAVSRIVAAAIDELTLDEAIALGENVVRAVAAKASAVRSRVPVPVDPIYLGTVTGYGPVASGIFSTSPKLSEARIVNVLGPGEIDSVWQSRTGNVFAFGHRRDGGEGWHVHSADSGDWLPLAGDDGPTHGAPFTELPDWIGSQP